MFSRPANLAFVGMVCLAIGCNGIGNRSEFERDPFVMSHLTHGKGDPTFARSENASILDRDSSRLESAAVSRKPPVDVPDLSGLRRMSYAEAAGERIPAYAADHSWLLGRATWRSGRQAGWYLRYARGGNEDPFGGIVRLETSTSLGLLREGDFVRVTGHVIDTLSYPPTYRVTSLAIMD